MSFMTLLDLPTSEAIENLNIHLLMEDKQMSIRLMHTTLTFLTYYATNDYRKLYHVRC